jgi:hypothetical protein
MYTGTVSSNTGSCPAGYTGTTLGMYGGGSANLPFTATQAEWFTFAAPNTLSASIPGTITYPYTITTSLSNAPVPGFESNVASHGRIIINSDEFDYMGTNFGAAGAATLTLVDGPTSINGGAGDATSSVVFPLNTCNAMYNNPWPVVPTLNSNAATPLYATYYPGLCGGNAAMALPSADADAWIPEASGFSVAYFNNLSAQPTNANSLTYTNNNGSMFIYEAGNNTGYGNTFDNFRVAGLWGGFMQGPASVDSGSGTCASPGSVTNPTIPLTTSWAPYLIPVDFTGRAGCLMEVVAESDYRSHA